MMDDNGFLTEFAALCTIGICVMTLITFGITIGAWETSLWESSLVGATIIGSDGLWGEDLVVVYNDGTTESVKGVSDNYWTSMSIRDDGSRPISTVQYCLNAKIPTSETFDTREYECMVTVVQDDVVVYQITYTYVSFVGVEANEWVRIVDASLDIVSISSGLNDGIYTVSFDNSGTIEGIVVPEGHSIDISVTDGIVRFLV